MRVDMGKRVESSKQGQFSQKGSNMKRGDVGDTALPGQVLLDSLGCLFSTDAVCEGWGLGAQ